MLMCFNDSIAQYHIHLVRVKHVIDVIVTFKMSSILICSSGGINTYSNKQNLLVCGPIYKESYARLMTAQHLRRTYAELVNCERLTKNRKLNLRKIYAKLKKNLSPHKCCHKSINHKKKLCHFTDPWSFSLFTNNNIYI